MTDEIQRSSSKGTCKTIVFALKEILCPNVCKQLFGRRDSFILLIIEVIQDMQATDCSPCHESSAEFLFQF